MPATLLEMQGITKSFPGVKVLEQVNFTLQRGEVHALMGENGAGKSTLMKILGGIYPKDSGSIAIDGNAYDIPSPSRAQQLGIVIIHQELNLVPHLTVMENIFLGREFTYGKSHLLNWRRMRQESHRYLSQLGLNIDPHTLVNELSIGQQQMVEIAKALSMKAKILVLDEPTAALMDREIEALFQVIASLKQQGVGMIYISHRMEEIFIICDQVTVMRDGHYIGTEAIAHTTMDHLITMMVGREITDRFPKMKVALGEEKLTVRGLTQQGKLQDISLSVRAGEIVGIAELMGAGRTELTKALFGVTKIERGTVAINGKPVSIHQPIDAIRAGIGLITEDRKDEGLLLPLSINDNLALPNLKLLSAFGFMNRSKERELADSTIHKLLIKTPDSGQKVGSLSGGNQQKVVIGKWLTTNPQVLILDEPTRGVDIGAKKEIYDLMLPRV